MGVHQQLSVDELICDMLSDEKSFDEIAKRLMLSVYAVEQRFKVICAKLGKQAK